jgi:MFS family permease
MTSAAAEPRLPTVGFAGRLSLVLLTPLVALAQVSVTPILPKISAHFAAVPEVDALVRVLITGMLAAQIVGAIIAGLLGGRVPLRHVVLSALGVYAVAGALGYVIDDLYVLIVSRIVVGGACAAALIAMLGILTTQLPPGLRDRWLGFNIVAGTFGAVVLTPLAGWIGGHDWRSVLLLHLLAIPVIALIAIVVPAAPPLARAAEARPARGGFPLVLVLMALAVGSCLNAGGAFFPTISARSAPARPS